MRHRRVDHLRLPRGGPVAEAVVGRAQVRAALDHPARELLARLPEQVAVVGRGHARVAAGRSRDSRPRRGDGACTSPTSTPRRSPSCRRARSRSAGSCRPGRCPRSRRASGSARGTRPATCSPSASRPACARRPRRRRRRRDRRARRAPTRPRSGAPCRSRPRTPRRPRRRPGRRDGGRGRSIVVPGPPGRFQLAPGDVLPPVAVVVEAHRAGRLPEDERAGHEQCRVGVRVRRGIEWPLRHRHVLGLPHEAPELGRGDRMLVHPEPVHRDPVDRPLLRDRSPPTPSRRSRPGSSASPRGELLRRRPAPRCG